MLYGRTAFSLFISLFTSRITLHVLGVDNFGINSAVAGFITMFSFVTGSLSASISRHITFELGSSGNSERLNRIFSTSINIQLGLGFILLIIGETFGVWFINTQMNIPEGRMEAANWVFQFALFSFFVGLSQIPYNACIIGHEKMNVFAWVSIAESCFRLVIACLLYISPFDKLISISVMGFVVSQGIRMAVRLYCNRKFIECHYKFCHDKVLLKELTSFAGWSFLTNTVWIFGNQGINILINIFFGVTFNAARGLANGLEGIIKKFTIDFMTAMNPQITKSYAVGEIDGMNMLICRGTRLSYLLLFTCTLPLIFEAHTIFYLWLGTVPDYTVLFFRLTSISVLVTLIGQTGVKAIMATGNIKCYTIVISSVTILILPLSWLAYKLGGPVEISYIIFIIIYGINDVIRLFFMKHLWGFSISMFINEAILPIMYVTVISFLIPFILRSFFDNSLFSSLLFMCICFVYGTIIAYTLGLKHIERKFIKKKLFRLE